MNQTLRSPGEDWFWERVDPVNQWYHDQFSFSSFLGFNCTILLQSQAQPYFVVWECLWTATWFLVLTPKKRNYTPGTIQTKVLELIVGLNRPDVGLMLFHSNCRQWDRALWLPWINQGLFLEWIRLKHQGYKIQDIVRKEGMTQSWGWQLIDALKDATCSFLPLTF